MTEKDKITLTTMSKAWCTLSKTMRNLDAIRYAGLVVKGQTEYNRLVEATKKGVSSLNKALSGYKWVEDKIDYVPTPWVVCALKKDDCDGSAWLLSSLMPGSIYLIANMNDGTVQKYDKWHYIFYGNDKTVWSNYSLAAEGVEDIGKWAKKKYSWANMIIKVDSSLNAKFTVTDI